ncbi:hypothetical protein ACFSM9_26400, partial [Microvirga arabica]|uniref:hypothetical protein n=1 Tax=Microvirga arabica TaxID=1128671 RepID=UPI00363A54C3
CDRAASQSSQQQARKSRAMGPAKLRFDIWVKTFQRERPMRQRREEESGAALISAAADIVDSPCLSKLTSFMQGLRARHDVELTKAIHGIC